MKKAAAAAANHFTSELILPIDLIQIEEPGERDRGLLHDGLAIGLELGTGALFVAISVGGNAEMVEGSDGGGFMPAIVGYDEAGQLVAGDLALADMSMIGAAGLVAGETELDHRGADLAARLTCLLTEAHRRLVALLGKSIVGAVLVVTPELPMDNRALLLAASEEAGIEIMRLLSANGSGTGTDVLDAAIMAEEMSRVG